MRVHPNVLRDGIPYKRQVTTDTLVVRHTTLGAVVLHRKTASSRWRGYYPWQPLDYWNSWDPMALEGALILMERDVAGRRENIAYARKQARLKREKAIACSDALVAAGTCKYILVVSDVTHAGTAWEL